MITRRQLLKTGMAAGALAQVPGLAKAGAIPAGFASVDPGMDSYCLVYDERYAECRSFADALRADAHRVFAPGADAGEAYFALSRLLAERPLTVIGLTPDSTFLILSQATNGVRARLAHYGVHTYDAADRLTHRLSGTATHAAAGTLPSLGHEWPGALARFLRVAPQRTAASETALTTALPRAPAHAPYLVSWLYVPAA